MNKPKHLHIPNWRTTFSNGEAEAIASELCRIGYVDYVVTEDMDTLTFGCPNMIRNCMDKSNKRKDMISIINLNIF